MRNIKFRFWDNRVNKFRYDLLISNANQYEGLELDHVFPNKVYDIYNDYGGMFSSGLDGYYRVREDVSNHVVVQQYTGLKDKNDVEIYEGDIIIFDNSDIGGQRYKGIVEWNTDPTLDGLCFGLFIPPKFEGKSGWLSCDFLGDLEVVGNIFEGVDK